MQPIPLFLDIDGVFSIKHEHLPKEHISGLSAHPIPMCNALLRLIDADPILRPLWLSSWGEQSVAWNKRAGTQKWPVAYPLDPQDAVRAERKFGVELHHNKPDEKLIAVWWYMQLQDQDTPLIWMEDGFAPETILWAHERGNVRLIDTRNPQILAALTQKCAGQDECVQVARKFMAQWIDAKVSV